MDWGDLWTGAASTAIDKGLDVWMNSSNNDAAMDRVEAGQTGTSASNNTSAAVTDSTSSSNTTASNNTSSNTSSIEAILSELSSNSTVNSDTLKNLEALVNSTTTSGTAESQAALSDIFGQIDPSQFSQEAAQKAGADASSLALQQVMQGGIGNILGAGSATGSFGNTAQAQLALQLGETAARTASSANLQAQDDFATRRSNEMSSLLEAIRAGQAGSQSTTQDSTSTESGTNTEQSTTDQTQSSNNTSSSTTDSTSDITQSTDSTNSTESAQVDQGVASSTANASDDFIENALNGR